MTRTIQAIAYAVLVAFAVIGALEVDRRLAVCPDRGSHEPQGAGSAFFQSPIFRSLPQSFFLHSKMVFWVSSIR